MTCIVKQSEYIFIQRKKSKNKELFLIKRLYFFTKLSSYTRISINGFWCGQKHPQFLSVVYIITFNFEATLLKCGLLLTILSHTFFAMGKLSLAYTQTYKIYTYITGD